MENTENPAVYFASLTLENLKCFQGKHDINLSTPEGKPAMWTVILGNNNTGKTTILRALADLELENTTQNIDEYVPKGFFKDLEPPFGLLIEGTINHSEEKENIKYNFGFWGGQVIQNEKLKNFSVYGYGVTRKSSTETAITKKQQNNTSSLFYYDTYLTNLEEWILQLDSVATKGNEKAKKEMERLRAVLGGKRILPDVQDFSVEIEENPFRTYVLFHTDFGKVRLQDLGYGYQSMLSWLVDFMYRMFLRYPESENPLAEPAIVLLDEIDLHLHPDWQRKIIGFLSDIFKKTQFIVTTHSPLILQSAENINVVILEKDQETAHIKIHQPERTNFQAWTIEEILDDLMGMRDKILSEEHKQLLQDFNEGLEKKEYAKAKKVYEKLSKMLHPDSPEKKLLRLQMTSIPRKK